MNDYKLIIDQPHAKRDSNAPCSSRDTDSGVRSPSHRCGGLIADLFRTPTEAISEQRRSFLRISAALICLGSLGAGVLFFSWVFRETDPWARCFVALFTFGLFGMPTTIAAIILLGLLAHIHAPNYNIAAIALMATYLVQWQLLAWGILRRSGAPPI